MQITQASFFHKLFKVWNPDYHRQLLKELDKDAMMPLQVLSFFMHTLVVTASTFANHKITSTGNRTCS